MTEKYIEGIGRRKEASARVRISSGNGVFTVNEKPARDYFGRIGDIESILSPLVATGLQAEAYDITVHVNGGGVTGQTDAATLGLARALLKMDEEYNHPLRQAGLLTRDSRVKERKKPGLKKARKAPTYTKR